MFSNKGLIIPDSRRVEQPDDDAPYAQAYKEVEPRELQCGTLAQRNRQYYNIGNVEEYGATEETPVPLACHHVVSWEIIWKFWNALITNKHFDVARSYLALFDVFQQTTRHLQSQINAGKFKSEPEWEQEWKPEWEQRFCWKPNNIVRGPKKRSDDPSANANGGLEDKIDFQKAPSHIYGGRVAGLVGAGRDMCQYIKSRNVDKAREAVAYFKSIRNEGIMDWNEGIWAVDSKSDRYSRKPSEGGGYKEVQPKWRVHFSKEHTKKF